MDSFKKESDTAETGQIGPDSAAKVIQIEKCYREVIRTLGLVRAMFVSLFQFVSVFRVSLSYVCKRVVSATRGVANSPFVSHRGLNYLKSDTKCYSDTKCATSWAYACITMFRGVSLNCYTAGQAIVSGALGFLRGRAPAQRCAGLSLAGSRAYSGNMTAPLVPGQPQRTEFSFGPGHFAHPESDYQSNRDLNFTQDFEPLADQYRDLVTDKRTDPTDPTSVGHEDQANLFVAGNPDTFGPGPALVKTTAQRPSGQSPQPVFRSGVTREE